MDFFFISSLINMIWQIFTILFVLYRFTSFFNMIYNFVLFINKLFKGVFYIKDQISIYINKRRGYSYFTENEMNESSTHPKSWFTKLKEWVFGQRSPSQNIPLFETRHSYLNNSINTESQFNERSPFNSESHFDQQYNDTDSRFHSTLYKMSTVNLEQDEEELADALLKSSNEF